MSLSFDSNNSNQDNIYGAIVVAQSHFKSWPSSFDECWLSASWPPTRRPCQITWAVSLPNTGCSYSHSPSPFFYYYSARKLILSLGFQQSCQSQSQLQVSEVRWQHTCFCSWMMMMTMMVIIDMWNYTHFAGISVVDYFSAKIWLLLKSWPDQATWAVVLILS